MMNKINKYYFFFKQLELQEFLMISFNMIFRKNHFYKDVRRRETMKFLDARFNQGTKIIREGDYSIVEETLNYKNVIFLMRRFTSDFVVYNQIILRREFEPIVEIFKKNNFVPRYCIDAGANVGLTTLYLKSYYPELKIVAIEPNNGNFKVLLQNIKRNKLEYCRSLEMGLWSSEITLMANQEGLDDNMEWAFSLKESSENHFHVIKGVTIDRIMQESDFPSIDFLKMDIEGAEEEIFENPANYSSFLKKTKAISVEIHSLNFEKKFNEILGNFGFETFKFGELTFGFRIVS